MYTIETIKEKVTFTNAIEASNYLDAALTMNLFVAASKTVRGKYFVFKKEERCWEQQ